MKGVRIDRESGTKGKKDPGKALFDSLLYFRTWTPFPAPFGLLGSDAEGSQGSLLPSKTYPMNDPSSAPAHPVPREQPLDGAGGLPCEWRGWIPGETGPKAEANSAVKSQWPPSSPRLCTKNDGAPQPRALNPRVPSLRAKAAPSPLPSPAPALCPGC